MWRGAARLGTARAGWAQRGPARHSVPGGSRGERSVEHPESGAAEPLGCPRRPLLGGGEAAVPAAGRFPGARSVVYDFFFFFVGKCSIAPSRTLCLYTLHTCSIKTLNAIVFFSSWCVWACVNDFCVVKPNSEYFELSTIINNLCNN